MKERMGTTQDELQRAKEMLDQAREEKRLRNQPLVVDLEEEEETLPKEAPDAPPFPS